MPARARTTRVEQACWSVVAVLLVVCVFHQWYGFDIWYHLALGREVVQTGSPGASGTVLLHQPAYRNIYWVFQLVAWFAYSLGGMTAVTALLAGAWVAAFALWMSTAKGFAFPALGIPASAIAIVACQLRFEERPEVVSYLLLAAHLWFIGKLDAGTITRNQVLIWVGSQVVWTNVHGYFVLGPVVLALRLVCNRLAKQRRDLNIRGWWILAAVGAATLVSPFGLGAWGTVLEFARYFTEMKRAVIEFRPYPFSGYGWTVAFFWSWSFAVTLLAIQNVVKNRTSLYEPALGLLGVALGASSARNAPLAVIMSGPLLAQHFPRMGGFLARRGFRMLMPALTAVLALTYSAHVLATGSYAPLVSYGYSPGSQLATDDYPVWATEYLRASGFAGSVFAHPSDGSYLEYALPTVRPYGDSRFIDVGLTSQYFRALRNRDEFAGLHAQWNFDAVLVNVREDQISLISLLHERRTWSLVYADPYRCVLANRLTRAGAGIAPGSIRFYTGQSFERSADYNAAGSWFQGFAEAGRDDLFATALRQLGAAQDFPPEFRDAARAYAVRVRSREVAEAARVRPDGK